MALSEHASGTQTCSVGTEHTVTGAETEDGVFQFFADLADMAAGDTVEFRIKEKVVSGGTQRTVFTASVAHVQAADDAVWVSPSVILIHDWDFSIKQTAGVSCDIPWSIRQVA